MRSLTDVPPPSQVEELLLDEEAVAEEGKNLTKVLIVVAAAVFLASLDMFIVNIAFPAIQADFTGSSIEFLSWVLNGYMIVFAALLMPFGRLADRLGRKRIFMAGLLIFCISSAACALAWSVDSLIAFRVIQGVGAAMLMSTSLALLLHHFPQNRWPVAIGVWAAAGGMAAALGPPLSRIPTIEIPMFASRPFSMACLTGLLFMVAFSAVLLGGVLYFTSVWGYSVIQAGLAFAPGAIMAAVFAIPAGRLGARYGSGLMAGLGGVILAAGSLWWLARMGNQPDYLYANLPGQILTGIGVGLALPNISAAVASTLPPTQLATGSAVLSAGRQIGAVLGVSVLVAILGATQGHALASDFDEAWIFTAATGVLAGMVALLIGTAAKTE